MHASHLSGFNFAHQIGLKNEKLLFIATSIDKENQSNLNLSSSFFAHNFNRSFGNPEISDSFRAHYAELTIYPVLSIWSFMLPSCFFRLISIPISKLMITQIC